MKLIFLDVDGVLNHDNSPGWTNGSMWVLDNECCWEINRILRDTDARVVLSSTWRTSDTGCDLVKETLVDGRIIGATPIRMGHMMGGWRNRKAEIGWWLTENAVRFSIEKMAVIDDDNDADLGDGSFFQTSFENGGLTKEIADRIIQHLNN